MANILAEFAKKVKESKWPIFNLSGIKSAPERLLRTIGSAWKFLEDAWNQVRNDKNAPWIIKLAWLPTKIVGKALQQPTTNFLDAVWEVGKKVWEWKIWKTEWAIEAALSWWASAMTTIPIIWAIAATIDTSLEETWTKEDVTKFIESWSNATANWMKKLFSAIWVDISKDSARSYVNDIFNVARIAFWIKWGVRVYKGFKNPKLSVLSKTSEILKGSFTQNIPDLFATTIWAIAEAEWVDAWQISSLLKSNWINLLAWALPFWIKLKWKTKSKWNISPVTKKWNNIVNTVKNKSLIPNSVDLVNQALKDNPTIPTKKVSTNPIKLSDKNNKWNLVSQIKNLETQKANLLLKVVKNPKLQKVLNKVTNDIKVLKKKQLDNPPVERNKKVEIFNETEPTFNEKLLETPKKNQPKYTKKRILATKKLVQSIINEKKWEKINNKLAELSGKKDWVDIGLQKTKVKLLQDLTQENRMNELLDLWLENWDKTSIIDTIFEDTILTDESKLKLVDLLDDNKLWKTSVKNVKNTEKSVQEVLTKKSKTPQELLTKEELETKIQDPKQKERMKEILEIWLKDKKVAKEIILKDDILSETNKSNLLELLSLEADSNILKYEWIDWFDEYVPHLNIVTKLLSKARIWGKFWLSLQRFKAWFVDNLTWLFRSVSLKTKDGRRISMSKLWNWIQWKAHKMKKDVYAKLEIWKMISDIEKNWDSVNWAYNFIIKNYKKLISWDWIIAKSRRLWIEDARDNNSLFEQSSIKQKHTSKASVVSEFVWLEIEQRVRKLQKQIADKENKAAWLKKSDDWYVKGWDIELNDSQLFQIQKDVVGILPNSSQNFFNSFFTQYWKHWKLGKLIKWFREIWEELQLYWIVRELKKGYYHWYISLNKIKQFFKATWKELWDIKNIEQLNIDLFDKVPTPEQMSSILKQRKDIWYLHSGDPLSTALSYWKETAKLFENKMISDMITNFKKQDKEVWKFLDETLANADKKVLKDLYWLNREKWSIEKWFEKWLNATSWLTYVWNSNLLFQNPFTGTIYGTGKVLTNVLSGKWRLSWEVIGDIRSTSKYLFDEWLLSHRTNDIDLSWGWAATKKKLIAWNIKKFGFEKPVRAYTAGLIPQMQTIVASTYMSKVVKDFWWWIKKWENLSQAFERTLSEMPENKALEARWELAENVIAVENVTKGSRAVSKIFDFKAFNMVKAFARETFSSLVNSTADTIDIFHQWLKNIEKTDKPLHKRIVDSWLIDNIWDITAKWWAAFFSAQLLAKLLFDTEDERKEFTRVMVAQDIPDYYKWIWLNQLWPHWFSMFWGKLSAVAEIVWWVILADTAWWKQKAAEDWLKKLFSWLNKWFKTLKWPWVVEDTTSWKRKYTSNTFSVAGRIMGLSKEKAQFEQSSIRIQKQIKDLQKESPYYIPIVSNVQEYLTTLTRKFTDTTDKLKRNDFAVKVSDINQRINKDTKNPKNFSDWLDNALWMKEWEATKRLKWKLSEKFVKDLVGNKKKVEKLRFLVEEINWIEWLNLYPNDFDKTLESLRENFPILYTKFYKQLYNTVSKPWITIDAQTNQSVFLDSVINLEMKWKLLTSSISWQVQKLANLMNDKIRIDWEWIPATEYEKLATLDKILEVLDNTPELKNQIFDSLSVLVSEKINIDTIKDLFNAVKDFPQIAALYKRLAKLRWATFRSEADAEPRFEKMKWWTLDSDTIVADALAQKDWSQRWLPKLALEKFPTKPTLLKDITQLTKEKLPRWNLINTTQRKWLLSELTNLAWK